MPIPLPQVSLDRALSDEATPSAGELCCVPLSSPTLSEEEMAATANLFKALADPHRVRILNLLATCGEPVCVCEFVPSLGLTQPTVSFHLKKLAEAGLLVREQRGTWAYYSIDRDAMARLRDVITLVERT